MSTPPSPPVYTIDPDAITVSKDPESTNDIIAKLVEEAASNSFFGFDLEMTTSKRVRLVQIATRKHAYIFDIDLLGGASRIRIQAFLKPAVVLQGSLLRW